jgi:hypothetical protein
MVVACVTMVTVIIIGWKQRLYCHLQNNYLLGCDTMQSGRTYELKFSWRQYAMKSSQKKQQLCQCRVDVQHIRDCLYLNHQVLVWWMLCLQNVFIHKAVSSQIIWRSLQTFRRNLLPPFWGLRQASNMQQSTLLAEVFSNIVANIIGSVFTVSDFWWGLGSSCIVLARVRLRLR